MWGGHAHRSLYISWPPPELNSGGGQLFYLFRKGIKKLWK